MAAAPSTRRPGLRDERGFALIEPAVGAVLLGALVLAAVPSFLLMRKRAEEPAARANVRAALPALTEYAADHGTYLGATYAVLRAYDPGLPPVVLASLSDAGFCVQATVGSQTSSKAGPTAPIVDGACP